jgi:hypothetical protein
MRAAGSPLISYLQSRQPFFSADLFSFNLGQFGNLNLTSFDTDISYGGVTWSSAGPVLKRSNWTLTNTLNVPQLTVDLYSTGSDYAAGNIKQLIHQGYFDTSSLTLTRAVMPTPGDTSLGVVELFEGVIGDVTGGARGVTLNYNGRNVVMLQYMPKNIYKVGCLHSLYDSGCTVGRSSNTFSGTVTEANIQGLSWSSDPTSGKFAQLEQGMITFTSGVASGTSRGISWAQSTGVIFNWALYNAPVAGDTFTVTYGCDKTDGAKGCGFFNNLQHFRGFKFIPPAEQGL